MTTTPDLTPAPARDPARTALQVAQLIARMLLCAVLAVAAMWVAFAGTVGLALYVAGV